MEKKSTENNNNYNNKNEENKDSKKDDPIIGCCLKKDLGTKKDVDPIEDVSIIKETENQKVNKKSKEKSKKNLWITMESNDRNNNSSMEISFKYESKYFFIQFFP